MSRFEELRFFAQTWLGRELLPSDGLSVPDSLILPAALREIYQAFGAVPELVKVHNRLLPPSQWVPDGGYSIFYEENQGVACWAFQDADRFQDDPVVFQGVPQADGCEWLSENMNLNEWIRVMTFWQLVNGGYKFGGYSSGIPEAARIVESHYPHVGGHADGSTLFRGKPGQLICLAGPAGIPSVWAAGATAEDWATLSSALDFDWDYSPDDD